MRLARIVASLIVAKVGNTTGVLYLVGGGVFMCTLCGFEVKETRPGEARRCDSDVQTYVTDQAREEKGGYPGMKGIQADGLCIASATCMPCSLHKVEIDAVFDSCLVAMSSTGSSVNTQLYAGRHDGFNDVLGNRCMARRYVLWR